MIYQVMTETMFKDSFKALRPDNFTNEGLSELYHFLTDMGESEQVELDVIAICCEFSQEPLQDVLGDYGLEDIDELRDNTLVVAELSDGSVIYQVF